MVLSLIQASTDGSEILRRHCLRIQLTMFDIFCMRMYTVATNVAAPPEPMITWFELK